MAVLIAGTTTDSRCIFILANYDLTPEELAMIVRNARAAKIHGFGGFSGKVQDHKLVDMRIELVEPRDNFINLYKKGLTVGTSCYSFG